jgi:hypothetical protein
LPDRIPDVTNSGTPTVPVSDGSLNRSTHHPPHHQVQRGRTPEYTETDVNGAMPGGRPVEEGAKVVVRMATIEADRPTGTLQEEAGELRW